MKSLLSFCLFATVGLAAADLPMIIGHRGASHAAPENTLAAFKLAWFEGADGIEGDFYLTADGEVVCIHDKTTKRTAGVDLVIRNTSWGELSRLDVGSWKHEQFRGEPMPRLEDVLDVVPAGKYFFIEIKDDVRVVKPIRDILLAKKADPKRVMLIAFDADVIRECRKLMPEYQAHWLSSLKEIDRKGMAERYFAELQATGSQGLQFQATAPVRAEWLRKVKESGYQLTSWTVNDPNMAREMIARNVDFITTDRPGGLRTDLVGAAGRWNVRDHVPHEEFIIQSHRGAGELAPENSQETFELAWSLGTIPEADLRTTKDGVIVAFHDNDFSRMLPRDSAEMKKKGIQDLTWEEVSKLDIGAWKGPEFQGQRVPRLKDVFLLLERDPQRRIYIDIKNVDLKRLAEQAHAADLAPRLILASTVPKVIRDWKALAPDSATLHWMGGDEAALAERLGKLAEEDFAGVDQLQVHVKQSPSGLIPAPAFIEKTGATLRERGILFQVLPWRIKDPEVYVELLDLGVASFATDYPDMASETVRRYYGDGAAGGLIKPQLGR